MAASPSPEREQCEPPRDAQPEGAPESAAAATVADGSTSGVDGDGLPAEDQNSDAIRSLQELVQEATDEAGYDCSDLLLKGSERIARALAGPGLPLAVALARRMHALSTQQLTQWSLDHGMRREQTLAFFPLRRSEVAVTVCIVKPEHVLDARSRGLDLIDRYGQTFLALDGFGWSPPTHEAFVQARLFDVAADRLKQASLLDWLMPMVLLKGRGLLLKQHVPQPELKQGTRNPQFSARSVWTISIVDDTPPEVLKVGIRHGRVLIAPWNPSAKDVCVQEDSYEGNWLATKNMDMSSCHFDIG